MAKDGTFLRALAPRDLFVHLYEWQGACATYGHFVDPVQYIDMEMARETGLKLARRPTGGGIIFHTCDYAFSVLIGRDSDAYRSNTLESYALVNRWIGQLIGRVFGVPLEIDENGCCGTAPALDRFCMAQPTQYDLVVRGRKVGGAAQRRTKLGVLHQGSICLTVPSRDYLEQVLVDGTVLADAMHSNSFPLLGPNANQHDLNEAREAIRGAILGL